jgi:phage terminase small subunit
MKLTIRQRKLIEELPRSKSVTEAARRAGYSAKHAGQAGHLALQRIAEKAPELLDDIETSLRELIEKNIKPGLTATKTIRIKYRGKVTTEFVEPDWATQLEMLKLCLRIHGAYPKE